MLKHDSVIIDYLRFVVPLDYVKDPEPFISKKGSEIYKVRVDEFPFELLKRILKVLKLDVYGVDVDDIVEKTGLWGYDYSVTVNECKLMYTDLKPKFSSNSDLFGIVDNFEDDPKVTIQRNADMGVCVELGGSACRRFEAILKYYKLDLHDILKRLFSAFPKIRIGRLDLARDIKQHMQGVTPLAFYRQCAQGYVESLSHEWHFQDSGELQKQNHGSTFTLGRRSSDFYMRIYDKLRERYFVHGDVWHDLDKEFWIRWEFELKHDLAQKVIQLFIDSPDMYSIYQIYLDVLTTKIWVNPSAKQLAKGHYTDVKKTVGHGFKQRVINKPMANWFFQFSQPVNRNKVVVAKPIKYKSGAELVMNYNNGSLFEKYEIHILHGGNPFILLAHWLKQGKLKRNDENYNALMSKLQNVQYDPSVIDDSMTKQEAYKILNDADKNFKF